MTTKDYGSFQAALARRAELTRDAACLSPRARRTWYGLAERWAWPGRDLLRSDLLGLRTGVLKG